MSLIKRSFSLSGHRTSVALEPAFWDVLERAARPGTLAALVARVDAARSGADERLASALRVTALTFSQMDVPQAGGGLKSSPDSPENDP